MDINFTQNFIALRRIYGFTQETIAEKLGVSRQAVTKWESGNSVPDIYSIANIAKVSSLIKRVLGSPLVECVQNHLVEFDIFAVYFLFFILLIDRIFLIDNNEYAISCLIFFGSFIVFEFIQKTWKKKRGHFTIQNRIFLYLFLIIFASFLSFVFIRYKKAPDKEEMYTLKEGETYPVGSKIEFKVKASGMEIEMPKEGDTRSIPYLYSIKSTTGETCVTGGWKDEEYRTTFSINENGKYTLTLTWKKQVYTDGRWTEQGTSTRSLDFYVGQDDVPVALRAPWESNKGTYIAVATSIRKTPVYRIDVANDISKTYSF